MIPHDLLPLVGVESYKRPSLSQIILPVKLAEGLFDSPE